MCWYKLYKHSYSLQSFDLRRDVCKCFYYYITLSYYPPLSRIKHVIYPITKTTPRSRNVNRSLLRRISFLASMDKIFLFIKISYFYSANQFKEYLYNGCYFSIYCNIVQVFYSLLFLLFICTNKEVNARPIVNSKEEMKNVIEICL